MSTAISSVLKTGVAFAGAAVVAVSPLAPTLDAHIPTVSLPAVELTGQATPALGAIPYQIGINTLGNLLALAPILVGSTEQCTVCFGPDPLTPFSGPFTGWGLIGVGAGLIASPIAFVKTLQGDGSVAQAFGAAALAVQTPISNTLLLLAADRVPIGGFALQAVLDRAFKATKDTIDYTVNILAQALVTGPLTVVKGATAGAQIFAATLAATGDVVGAINAGRAPFEAAVNTALTDLTNEVNEGRTTVYNDLLSGPGVATSPIPTSTPAPLAATAVAGPVTKKITSFKAVPARTATAAAATGDDNGSGTADSGSGSSNGKASKSTGGSKRQHKAD